jgi:hypothetical protein
MDEGERIIIEAAWRALLKDQNAEREALKLKQEKAREEFYRATKTHWDSAYEWHRKRGSA